MFRPYVSWQAEKWPVCGRESVRAILCCVEILRSHLLKNNRSQSGTEDGLYSDSLRAGWSGVRPPFGVGGRDFLISVQTGPCAHPATCAVGTSIIFRW